MFDIEILCMRVGDACVNLIIIIVAVVVIVVVVVIIIIIVVVVIVVIMDIDVARDVSRNRTMLSA